MPTLFNRTWALIVGIPGGEASKFVDLRVTFKVNKSLESTPNTAQIEIFNLNEHSRSLCEKKNSIVSLLVGYGTPEVLFTGNIKKVIHSKTGTTWQTSIESGDGETQIQTAKSNTSFPPGTGVKDILVKMGTDLGTAIGNTGGLETGLASFQHGFVASGSTAQVITNLTAKHDLNWSVQDGALQILPNGGSTSHEAVVVSSDTGLIGSVKKKGKLGGIEFECLCQPKIFPGRKISLQSLGLKGTYTAYKVSHHGDTHGNDWFTAVETSP